MPMTAYGIDPSQSRLFSTKKKKQEPISLIGTLDPNQTALADYLKELLMQNQGGGDYLSGLSSYLSGAGVGNVGPMPTTPELNIPPMQKLPPLNIPDMPKTPQFNVPSIGETPAISAVTGGAGLAPRGVGGNISEALRSALVGGVSEEYWQNTVAAPALKTFQEDIAPGIREEFAGPGTFWGGARGEAVNKGASNLAGSLAAARGEMANQALNRQVTAGLGLGELETTAAGQKANFMAQNYGNWVSARSQDYNTWANATGKSHADYLNARSQDYNTWQGAQVQAYNSWTNARSQDYSTWSNATGKGYADYLSARSQDYSTWQNAKTQEFNSYMDAYIKANPTSQDTINAILAYLNTPTQLAYQNPEYIPSAIKNAIGGV